MRHESRCGFPAAHTPGAPSAVRKKKTKKQVTAAAVLCILQVRTLEMPFDEKPKMREMQTAAGPDQIGAGDRWSGA
jgi:hypothetical protein